MQFLLTISLLVASVSAIAVPSAVGKHPQKSHDHTPLAINIDSAIVSRLEKLFEDPYSYPGAPPRPDASTKAKRASSDTRNDLTDGKCNDIIVIFARGTTSPGNIGDGEGPAFVDALAALRPGKTIVQGVVPYSASVAGYLANGDNEGAASMAALTARAASQCPGASIVWGGYSQGAQVAHKAAKKISTALYTRIKAIVLIGDPNDGDALPGALNTKSKTWCHDDDPICDGIPLPIGGHLNYEQDAPAMAAWVATKV